MAPWLLALIGILPSESNPVARVELSLTLDLAWDQMLGRLPETLPASGGSVDGLAHATIFLDGVRDDPTPLALQPFLQRGNTLFVTAAVGRVYAPDSIAGALLGDLAANTRRTRFSVGGELFVTRWLALTFESGFRFDRPTGDDPQSLRANIVPWSTGIALRTNELRLALGVDGFYRALDDGHQVTDETHLRFAGDLRAVLVNHIDVGIAVSAFDHGGDAAVHIDYYPTKHLGLLTRFLGGKTSAQPFPDGGTLGEFAGHDPVAAPGTHFGAMFGASYWTSPSLGVSINYQAAWIEGLTAGATDQRLILSIASRSFF